MRGCDRDGRHRGRRRASGIEHERGVRRRDAKASLRIDTCVQVHVSDGAPPGHAHLKIARLTIRAIDSSSPAGPRQTLLLVAVFGQTHKGIDSHLAPRAQRSSRRGHRQPMRSLEGTGGEVDIRVVAGPVDVSGLVAQPGRRPSRLSARVPPEHPHARIAPARVGHGAGRRVVVVEIAHASGQQDSAAAVSVRELEIGALVGQAGPSRRDQSRAKGLAEGRPAAACGNHATKRIRSIRDRTRSARDVEARQ